MDKINIKIIQLHKQEFKDLQNSQLILELSGTTVVPSVINSLRRICYLYVPTYAFCKESIYIEENTSVYNSDYMRLRLSQLVYPNLKNNIVFLPEQYWKDVDYSIKGRERYSEDKQITEIYVNKTNDTFDNINVTTNDLEIFEDGDRVDKYDKKYPDLLIKLRPKESFKFKAELLLGIGAVNDIWSSVGNMYHEEISKNKYKITIESLGQMDEYEALHKSCRIMQILMKALKDIINVTYNDSEISKQNKLILRIKDQDYTVGAVLNEFLQLNKDVVFSGISKPDHFTKEFFIKVQTVKPNPVKYITSTIDHINNIYLDLEKQILKLGKKYITYDL